jgi:glycerophosphoryl diester phosphodiesterase
VLVIAHRGAPGHRPEHTLAGYELAARMGADFIEQDLVPTADGALVVRHDNEVSGTTDIATRPEFAERRTTKEIGGRSISGWFTEDFTLAELRTLRARERIPDLRPGSAEFDGRFGVPSLADVLELRERLSRELGRELGIYPETKHPDYFRSIGLPLEEPLAELLRGAGLDGRDAPVFLQSFERDSLERLGGMVGARRVQLHASSAGAVDLHEVATYADAVGPAKNHIVPRDAEERSLAPTSLVDDGHEAGLAVHTYTFRSENAFLPAELRSSGERSGHGDAGAELAQFYALGVDAVFSDHPDAAVAARERLHGRM